MAVTVSAPGKVFVAGEYGVLLGGPAVLAAVDRRLRSRASIRAGSGHLWVRNGVELAKARLEDDVHGLPPAVRFAGAAAMAAARSLGLRGRDVAVETGSDLDAAAGKRGLGGSAAVTAATIAALYREAGRPVDASDLVERVSLGIESHRLAQRGGSGADVVAATVGGVIELDGLDAADPPRDAAQCRAATRVSFARIEIPTSLALEVVATGRPAASGPRATRFVRAADAQASPLSAAAVEAWRAGLRVAVEAFVAGCRRLDVPAALAALAATGRLLERLAPLAGIRVLTPELRRAQRVAAAFAAVAKPAGAGGGDCAIALVDRAERDALREAWARAGLEPLAVEVAREGVRVEATDREVWHGAP